MADVIDTVERDGKSVLVYDNGMERDANSGRMVRPPAHTLITAENSTEYHRARQDAKRKRMLAGAARHLEGTGEWVAPNDLDVVEAIGEKVMEKALDPKNAKQVDAARFIFQESGLSEQQGPVGDHNTFNMFVMPDSVSEFLSDLKQRLVSRTDILISDKDADSRVIDVSPTDQDQET